MLRIAERVAVYTVVGLTIWWQLYIGAQYEVVLVVAALATVALAALLVIDARWMIAAIGDRREAARSHEVAAEAERLRRSAYNLCAGLRLGFDICEECWTRHPDKAVRELDRLRAAVGQFVSMELDAPLSN
jgi:hypothetical protein